MIVMNTMDVLRDLTGAFRVQLLVLSRNCANLEAAGLDFLFRNQLYESYDYRTFASGIMDRVPEDQVISYKDEFGLHYLVFRGRDTETGSFIFIGPYVHHNPTEEEYRLLLKQHALPAETINAVRWYFKRIPVIPDHLVWRALMSGILARYLANPSVAIQSVTYNDPVNRKQKTAVKLSSIPHTSIEARYAVENAILEEIRRGNIAGAIHQQNLFMGFSLDRRVADPLRDTKDMIIAFNTLCRKAIEQVAVHPLYIDGISGQFVHEIEEAGNVEQVEALIPRMIRHYCLLVQQHSLASYTRVIRDCLNYIDFHYMEPLSLEILANRFSVNKNYLSSRFHREKGMTVTDYINQIRVNRAAGMLRHTSLSVLEVAEQCGFSDGNYFARIFKKLHGVTPNEYRKSNSQNR